MKADAEHILKTKKGSASSNKVYLAGFNANEGPEEYSRVCQPSNVSPGVSCQCRAATPPAPVYKCDSASAEAFAKLPARRHATFAVLDPSG